MYDLGTTGLGWCNNKEVNTVTGINTVSTGTTERVNRRHETCTKQKKHWSLRLVLELDGLMTWHVVGKASCQVTVGGQVTCVDVWITLKNDAMGNMRDGRVHQHLEEAVVEHEVPVCCWKRWSRSRVCVPAWRAWTRASEQSTIHTKACRRSMLSSFESFVLRVSPRSFDCQCVASDWKAAVVPDVLMKLYRCTRESRPRRAESSLHTTTTQHRNTYRAGALLLNHPGLRSTRVGPGRTHSYTSAQKGRPWVARPHVSRTRQRSYTPQGVLTWWRSATLPRHSNNFHSHTTCRFKRKWQVRGILADDTREWAERNLMIVEDDTDETATAATIRGLLQLTMTDCDDVALRPQPVPNPIGNQIFPLSSCLRQVCEVWPRPWPWSCWRHEACQIWRHLIRSVNTSSNRRVDDRHARAQFDQLAYRRPFSASSVEWSGYHNSHAQFRRWGQETVLYQVRCRRPGLWRVDLRHWQQWPRPRWRCEALSTKSVPTTDVGVAVARVERLDLYSSQFTSAHRSQEHFPVMTVSYIWFCLRHRWADDPPRDEQHNPPQFVPCGSPRPLVFPWLCAWLLCGHAEFVMNCSAVANFPEGVTQPNARGFMCSPAISEVLGCRGECVARAVEIVL